MKSLRYSCAAFSVLGKRQINEDTYVCRGVLASDKDDRESIYADTFTSPDLQFFGVFDGLGGETAGDVASLIAAEHMRESVGKVDAPITEQTIRELFLDANDAIVSYMKGHTIRSMGSTAAALICTPRDIFACNIGDSRIYCVSNHRISQLSTDHLSAPSCFGKPALTQCLGVPREEFIIEPAIEKHILKNETIYLLCSDGVSDCLNEGELLSILDRKYSADKKAEAIREAVREKNGKDNATAIVLNVRSQGLLW